MHGLDLTMPRRCARQVHRPNVGGSIEEFYRRTIYVPYMDSLIQSLESKLNITQCYAQTNDNDEETKAEFYK